MTAADVVVGSGGGYAVVHPLASMVPPILLADEVTRGLLDGLDQMLAPVVWTLDHLDAYLDPATAPPPFLRWMANWLGLGRVVDLLPALYPDRHEAVARERRLVRSTVRQLAGPVVVGPAGERQTIVDAAHCRGTVAGLVETLGVVLGPICVVAESAHTAVSRELTAVDDTPSMPASRSSPWRAAPSSLPAVRIVVDAWELPAHPDVVREAVRRVAALHVPAHVGLAVVVSLEPVEPAGPVDPAVPVGTP